MKKNGASLFERGQEDLRDPSPLYSLFSGGGIYCRIVDGDGQRTVGDEFLQNVFNSWQISSCWETVLIADGVDQRCQGENYRFATA